MSEMKHQGTIVPPPPKPSKAQIQVFYEKHFDPNHQAFYYYNPATGDSVWEVPEGSIIADMTLDSQIYQNQVPLHQNVQNQPQISDQNGSNEIQQEKAKSNKSSKADKKKEEEEKKRNEYRERMIRLEQLQNENLQMTYPEYFQQQQQQQESEHHEEQQEVHQVQEDQEQINTYVDKQNLDENIQNLEDSSDEYVDANQDNETLKDKQFQKDYKLFKQFRNQQIHVWMQKPARRQVQESKKDTAYVEGNYDYNIWYDKYLTDRNQQVEKAPSLYKCKPPIDTGYTKADKFEKKNSTYFCVYFARGCCTEGVNCRFYHRTPQEEDLEIADQDNLRDVFGRARHATHKEDNTGIGSFNKECRTLMVTDIQLPTDSLTPQRDIIILIYELFSPWGEIEDIYFNNHKCIAFIKYRHRYYAEFAREAMLDQVLYEGKTDPISIKWALDNPFDKSEAMRAQQEIMQLQQKNQSHISAKNKKKVQYLKSNALDQGEDPHANLTLQQKLALKPSDLVPQLSNPTIRKRELKIMEKDQHRDRLRELEQEQNQYSVSQGFESNLYQGQDNSNFNYSHSHITDASKVQENCNKMTSILQQIEMNKTQI